MATPPSPNDLKSALQAYQDSGDLNQLIKDLERVLGIQKDLAEILAKNVELRQKDSKELEKQLELSQQLNKLGNDDLDTAKLKLELDEKSTKEKAKVLLDKAKSVNLSETELQQLKKYLDTLKDIDEQMKDMERARSSGSKLANLLGIDEANKNSLTYQIFANPSQVMKGFTDEIESAGGYIQGFFLSTAMKIQEMTVQAFTAYDMAASSLAKVAGANEQLQNVLANTARGATAYGISFQEAGRSIEALYSNLNTFSNLNQGVQEQLTISVAKLDKLGISGQESAKQIGTLSQIMGMSEAQAAKTSEELAGFALAIGKSPQQVAQDFAGASNQLAGYGKNMVNVFKDLEAQSKATGVAVNDLISITEKFQTFEGAATAAGKLNAALGGGFINAMELLEASAENPAKAIDLLRTRLDEANISFEEMSFYEQKMIVDAGGFKSIEEASRILSQTNAQREEEIAQKQQLANQQKMLAEAIQRSIPLQEKLTMIMVNFGIVMGPVVDKVSGFLSLLAALFDKAPILSYALGGLLVIIGGFIIASKIAAGIASLGAAMNVLGISSATVAPAAAPAAAGITTVATAAGAAAVPVGAFGIALGSVVLPVAALVAAIALLVAAQALAIYGFAHLFDIILGKGDGVATTLATLGAAMFAIGIAFNNPIILLGMFNFSRALMGIVLAMTLLPEKKVVSFATISENLVKLGSIEGTNKTMEQASELVKTINEFKLDDKVSTNLEKILKAAIPQQQATQTQQQINPIIKVFIGDKEVQGLVTKVIVGTSQGVGTVGAG